jgi:hypothetical protein
VFSSSSLLTKRGTQGEFLQFFNLFYYTIISETIFDTGFIGNPELHLKVLLIFIGMIVLPNERRG